MNTLKSTRAYLLACGLAVILRPCQGMAQETADASKNSPRQSVEAQDGQHDFDFEIGVWKTHVRRRLHPLSGSTTWIEMDGTSIVRKVWNGRGNLVELEADGPAGHFEGLSLRLYNPQSRQWSLNFSNSS